MMIGVCNHLFRKAFRFHYPSQKVIGSLGYHFSFGFFVAFCGVVCDGNYCIHEKNAEGSGRGSFAEGCPSRKVAGQGMLVKYCAKEF